MRSSPCLGVMAMAILKHEVWKDPQGLTGLCFAGPMGDDFRALEPPGSHVIAMIEATSHFDAMTMYYALMGWGEYRTDFEADRETYPEAWRLVQSGSIAIDESL